MRSRIQAISEAEGPAGYRLLIGEFHTHWLRLEDVVNTVIFFAFVPRDHYVYFGERLLPELSFDHRLRILRDIAREREQWPGTAKKMIEQLDAMRVKRNKLIHRAPAFFGDDVPHDAKGAPWDTPTDLEAMKNAIHEVVALLSAVPKAFWSGPAPEAQTR